MSEQCNFRRLLAHHKIRPTAVRLAVLEIMGSANRVWSAREIMERMQIERRVNKVTIYRILDDFTQRGVIRKIPLEGKSTYELACQHHPPHPHFQCQRCGQVQCLEPVSLEKIWAELKGPLGNRADRLEIRVEGICQQCRSLGRGQKEESNSVATNQTHERAD